MTGWIIYLREDVEKNKMFVKMLQDCFRQYHIELELIILEETSDLEHHIMPDFAINRSRDYKIAERLEQKGVRVFNSSKVTRIANDKAETYKYFKDVVLFMPVWCQEEGIISDIQKEDIVFEYPYVMKTCRGHGGNQVFMIESSRQEKEALQIIGKEKYIKQKCCSDLGKDVRVYVVGNQIVDVVLRTSKESFKSNYSLGGNVEKYVLNEAERQMVHRITGKMFLDYAGIDFTFHHNAAVFNEIEDAVGARMLYQVSDADIVQIFTEYILDVLARRLRVKEENPLFHS